MDAHLSPIEQKAMALFRRPPLRLNCAQTVCAAMGRDDLVPAMQNCNVGKAPGGTCGALYAAICVAPEREQELRDVFCHTLGADTCAQLKRDGRVPCPQCVCTAVKTLHSPATPSTKDDVQSPSPQSLH